MWPTQILDNQKVHFFDSLSLHAWDSFGYNKAISIMLWSLGKIRFATNAILFFLLFFVNSLICPPANQWPLIMEEIVVFLFIPATPLSWSRNPKGLSWTDTAPCSGPKLCPVYGFLNYRWTRIPSFACCPRLRGLRPPLRKANANNDFVLPSNVLSRMHW